MVRLPLMFHFVLKGIIWRGFGAFCNAQIRKGKVGLLVRGWRVRCKSPLFIPLSKGSSFPHSHLGIFQGVPSCPLEALDLGTLHFQMGSLAGAARM